MGLYEQLLGLTKEAYERGEPELAGRLKEIAEGVREIASTAREEMVWQVVEAIWEAVPRKALPQETIGETVKGIERAVREALGKVVPI